MLRMFKIIYTFRPMRTSGLAVDWILSITSSVDIASKADGGVSAGICTDMWIHAAGFKYRLRELLRLVISLQSSHGNTLLILFAKTNSNTPDSPLSFSNLDQRLNNKLHGFPSFLHTSASASCNVQCASSAAAHNSVLVAEMALLSPRANRRGQCESSCLPFTQAKEQYYVRTGIDLMQHQQWFK